MTDAERMEKAARGVAGIASETTPHSLTSAVNRLAAAGFEMARALYQVVELTPPLKGKKEKG